MGELLIGTNASRSYVYLAAKALDDLTDSDWSARQDRPIAPRAPDPQLAGRSVLRLRTSPCVVDRCSRLRRLG